MWNDQGGFANGGPASSESLTPAAERQPTLSGGPEGAEIGRDRKYQAAWRDPTPTRWPFDIGRLVKNALDVARVDCRGRHLIGARQRRRLAKLVAFARVHSPYYRKLYRTLGPVITDIQELPVTTKPGWCPSTVAELQNARFLCSWHSADFSAPMRQPAMPQGLTTAQQQ